MRKLTQLNEPPLPSHHHPRLTPSPRRGDRFLKSKRRFHHDPHRNDRQLLHHSFGLNQHRNRTFFLALFRQNSRLNSTESNRHQPSLLPRRSTRNDEQNRAGCAKQSIITNTLPTPFHLQKN